MRIHANLLLLLCAVLQSPALEKRVDSIDATTKVLPGRNAVYLLNAREASQAILCDDGEPFFSVLTTLDMAVRMGKPLDPMNHADNKARFREFLQRSVKDWTAEEKEVMFETLRFAHEAAAKVNPAIIPSRWMFIKTDGSDESGAAYTRGPCIVIPQELVTRLLETHEASELVRTILHETFHLYLRDHPDKRDRLYEALGFKKLDSIVLGNQLSRRRITNPDAPGYSHAITLRDSEGKSFHAILVTYSRVPDYNPEIQGLFSYVTFGLFEVNLCDQGWKVVTDPLGDLRPIDPATVEGFFEQVGRNTSYLIHPEEILADNLALLAMARASGKTGALQDFPDPHILQKLEAALKAP